MQPGPGPTPADLSLISGRATSVLDARRNRNGSTPSPGSSCRRGCRGAHGRHPGERDANRRDFPSRRNASAGCRLSPRNLHGAIAAVPVRNMAGQRPREPRLHLRRRFRNLYRQLLRRGRAHGRRERPLADHRRYGNIRRPARHWPRDNRLVNRSKRQPIAFTDTWRGLVDFDNIAPTIKVRRATATRLGKGRSYVLRLSFACPDNVAGNNVSYTVLIGTAASDLAKRAGKTTAIASLSLRVRPPRSARFVSVDITATDPVGNLRTTARRVPLRRRRS